MQEPIRQGDVYLYPITKEEFQRIKGAEVPREEGRVVLAHGEKTGHHHSIFGPAVMFMDTGSNGGMASTVLQVDKPVKVEHQEHTALNVDPGHYRVVQQREVSANEVAYVAD